jgi:uncharacterized protein
MPTLKRAGARHAPLLLGALLLLGAVTARAQSGAPVDLATFPRATLEIVHRDHKAVQRHEFDAWVADTEARAEQGLMFVSDLPDSKGMVFPLDPPRMEAMWMKNTYIELDMLFVGTDGRVVKIIERARPLSLQTLSSGQVVGAVIELKGGEVARLGLAVGDQVSWQDRARKPAG